MDRNICLHLTESFTFNESTKATKEMRVECRFIFTWVSWIWSSVWIAIFVNLASLVILLSKHKTEIIAYSKAGCLFATSPYIRLDYVNGSVVVQWSWTLASSCFMTARATQIFQALLFFNCVILDLKKMYIKWFLLSELLFFPAKEEWNYLILNQW